jgi:hypothetical protein
MSMLQPHKIDRNNIITIAKKLQKNAKNFGQNYPNLNAFFLVVSMCSNSTKKTFSKSKNSTSWLKNQKISEMNSRTKN